MDDHPRKTPAIFVGEPMVQAHIRVPDSVNRSEWLKRKSGGRRRRSVHGSRHAGGTPIHGRGNPTTERNFSPPPRDRDVSVDSTTSSVASSTSTTVSRLSMVSAPPQRAQLRHDNSGYQLGARLQEAGVGDRGRGHRRRGSFDAGAQRAAPTSAAAASAETLSSTSASSPTQCVVCLADFTRYRRPHRCRACGKTVCATCSPARMPKRTCKRCAGDSAAPRVVATVSPRRKAVVAPYAPPTGVARASRRSVGSSARVLVAGAPSKPAVVVARATYPAMVVPDGPEEVDKGEPEGPKSPNNAKSSKGGVQTSDSVDGVGEGEGSDLLAGVGRGELEASTSRAGDGNEEVEGLGRLDGDRVETVGAFGGASHMEDTVHSPPNGVLSTSSPNRMVRKGAAAEQDDAVLAGSAGSGRGGFPPLFCGASDDTEGQAVGGPGATATGDAEDRAVCSEGAGGGGRVLEEAAHLCPPADSSVELAAPPVNHGERQSHEEEGLEPPVSEHGAPEVVPAIDGESSHTDEILKPPVSEQSAPEVVAEAEAAAADTCSSCAAAAAAAATPSHSLTTTERAEQQPATTDSWELELWPHPIESTGQPETAPSSETATELEPEAAQPEEEGLVLLEQDLAQPARQRRSFEEDDRMEEEEEEEEEEEAEEVGVSVKDTGGEGSADGEAAGIEIASSQAVSHKRHQEEEEEVVGEEEREHGVAQEVEGNCCVEGGVDNEQDGTEELLAATAELCAESSVDDGPMDADREAADLVVADVPRDTQENEGQRDSGSEEAMVEGKDGFQRKERDSARAPVAGLRLGNGGGEELVATKLGDMDPTAAQQGGEEERGEDEDVEVAAAATAVGGRHGGEGGVDFSAASRGVDAESQVSEHAGEPEEGSGLLVTLPTDEDAERGASSQDEQVGDKEQEEGMAAVAAAGPPLDRPSDGASGLADSDPAGGALLPASVPLGEEESARALEEDKMENVVGERGPCDHESGVTDKSIVAPALPRDEVVGGGGLERTVESPTTDIADNGSAVGPSTPAGESCLGEATMLVAPPLASHPGPHTTRNESRGAAVGGDMPSARGVVLAEAGEGGGGVLAALKGLIQKGGSCCR